MHSNLAGLSGPCWPMELPTRNVAFAALGMNPKPFILGVTLCRKVITNQRNAARKHLGNLLKPVFDNRHNLLFKRFLNKSRRAARILKLFDFCRPHRTNEQITLGR